MDTYILYNFQLELRILNSILITISKTSSDDENNVQTNSEKLVFDITFSVDEWSNVIQQHFFFCTHDCLVALHLKKGQSSAFLV